MKKFLKKFSCSESGAVTVDWVVLIAAVVGLGLVVVTSIDGGVSEQESTTEQVEN